MLRIVPAEGFEAACGAGWAGGGGAGEKAWKNDRCREPVGPATSSPAGSRPSRSSSSTMYAPAARPPRLPASRPSKVSSAKASTCRLASTAVMLARAAARSAAAPESASTPATAASERMAANPHRHARRNRESCGGNACIACVLAGGAGSIHNTTRVRRGGRAVECASLLKTCPVKSWTAGSNPALSVACPSSFGVRVRGRDSNQSDTANPALSAGW